MNLLSQRPARTAAASGRRISRLAHSLSVQARRHGQRRLLRSDLRPSDQDGKLLFLLGDVSGKGRGRIAADDSFARDVSQRFRVLISSSTGCSKWPIACFAKAPLPGQYATLVCGRVGRDGDIEIASAGHFPALLTSKRRRQADRSDRTTDGNVRDEPLHRSSRCTSNRGIACFFTRMAFRKRTTHSAMNMVSGGLSVAAGKRHGWAPKELVAACLKDVERHCSGGRQADDQTLMAIQRVDSVGASFND